MNRLQPKMEKWLADEAIQDIKMKREQIATKGEVIMMTLVILLLFLLFCVLVFGSASHFQLSMYLFLQPFYSLAYSFTILS